VTIARVLADVQGLKASCEAVAQSPALAGAIRMACANAGRGGIDFIGTAPPSALRAAIETHIAPCDALIADDEIRIPHLFVSDMDSTMIGQECIDELADFAGLKPQIAAITEAAMRGELDFRAALAERVALLAGLGEGAIAQCLAERIRPMPGARTLVQTLKAHGCRTVLVTGGFHQFADPVAAMLGFEHVVANRLDVKAGQLTGKLTGPICDSNTKLETLIAETAALGEGVVSLATGDGANDIPMIRAASHGIAYHAKPKARDAASGWIDRGDLTSVLRLFGIAEDKWIQG